MGYYHKKRYSQWAPYVSVADRRREAEKRTLALKKKGIVLKPVVIEGRTISKTFWGKAWCENLEAYSDFANRLPRGRTYVRNGSVIDLHVAKGSIVAQVMGSSLYHVEIDIRPMAADRWEALVKACAGKIDSLIELLQGKFSKAVMALLTEQNNGLFPKPSEIQMCCSCPDSAGMCKHIAAALYGVGAYLDDTPEHLFTLRHVDHLDLLSSATTSQILTPANAGVNGFSESDLSSMFGIEIDTGAPEVIPIKVIAEKKKSKTKPVVIKAKKDQKTDTSDQKPSTAKRTTPKKKALKSRTKSKS